VPYKVKAIKKFMSEGGKNVSQKKKMGELAM